MVKKKQNIAPRLLNRTLFMLVSIYFSATPVFADEKLKNPITVGTIPEVIGLVLKGLLGLAGVAALLMVMWGGIQMMLSQGEPKKYQNGLQALTWAAIGLGMVFGSYAVVDYLLKTILGKV